MLTWGRQKDQVTFSVIVKGLTTPTAKVWLALAVKIDPAVSPSENSEASIYDRWRPHKIFCNRQVHAVVMRLMALASWPVLIKGRFWADLEVIRNGGALFFLVYELVLFFYVVDVTLETAKWIVSKKRKRNVPENTPSANTDFGNKHIHGIVYRKKFSIDCHGWFEVTIIIDDDPDDKTSWGDVGKVASECYSGAVGENVCRS
jgi:hypothetical protein